MSYAQAELFPLPGNLPEGFAYRPDMLTREQGSELVGRLRELDLKPFEFQGYAGNRRVASFGLSYDFAAAALREGKPIPVFLLPLREKAASFAGLKPALLPHVLVTEYRPGAGIGWHRDRPHFEDVIGISLVRNAASGCGAAPEAGGSACRSCSRRDRSISCAGPRAGNGSTAFRPASIFAIR
jgi:alkylated DNA repair dioxygenase AlkB